MRVSKKRTLENISGFKNALLKWAQQFQEIVWLDSNDYGQEHSKYDAILAVDAFTALKTGEAGAFDALEEYQQTTADWIFGYLSYDLKNDLEALSSKNHDGLHFPALYFFQPKKLFLIRGQEVELLYLRLVDDEIEEDYSEILKMISSEEDEPQPNSLHLQPRIPKAAYLEKVREMLRHIQRGDIYEANFCQEFFSENAKIQPLHTYRTLNNISNPPFASYVKLYDLYLLSASPERYLQKKGKTIISQPIKGTAARSKDPVQDQRLATELEKDPKERSENVMIVDLVRNDLSKIAAKGSVEVTELCKIYSFQQVHQMISTVKARLAVGIPAVEVLRSTFPMGSMTGAPKISAMKIIEELEETKRSVYSGAVGYFTPREDFDFNVVIRSILYNASERYVSFSVGGAITSRSIPENEYRECLVKAKALLEVLGSSAID
ncbi:para-aminobenzoate synthetase component 1 [Salinimicrobium catena]|uniref:Para-aminobenzoate synthetase component 1 n=1 Tax=Salinimicrobium catena TaxID=390640 RepID=A0A1H5LD50_9FLAO|nr:anthranilate synthase component I family protein [Salinimicrobium catena]SDL08215.1 para-aminobenzoate synthetase component 1 [Salinimicrobium catena]SEE74487.1 para-aminobenzoate synthetase component 1 [Salinimicrobium catena]